MAKFKRYDVFMKMLEIIEHDTSQDPIAISEEQRRKIKNVIGKIDGDVLLQQIFIKEINMDIGDKFENISQSIIATRGSIVTGIIRIRERGEYDLANALEKLGKSIHEATTSDMSEESKQDAFQLLDELTKQASSPTRVRTVLKTLGKGLWEVIKNVGAISKIVMLVWPIIERLWI